MFKFYNKLLPIVFDSYDCIPASKIHNYNTELVSKLAYLLPRVKANTGIFYIQFSGTKVWNSNSRSS